MRLRQFQCQMPVKNIQMVLFTVTSVQKNAASPVCPPELVLLSLTLPDAIQCTFLEPTKHAELNTEFTARLHRCVAKFCRFCLKNRYDLDFAHLVAAVCAALPQQGHIDSAGYIYKYVVSLFHCSSHILVQVSQVLRHLQLSPMPQVKGSSTNGVYSLSLPVSPPLMSLFQQCWHHPQTPASASSKTPKAQVQVYPQIPQEAPPKTPPCRQMVPYSCKAFSRGCGNSSLYPRVSCPLRRPLRSFPLESQPRRTGRDWRCTLSKPRRSRPNG